MAHAQDNVLKFPVGGYFMDTTVTEFDLKIRCQIYRFLAENCRAPSYQEIVEFRVNDGAVDGKNHAGGDSAG